jgi:hypothetical protein
MDSISAGKRGLARKTLDTRRKSEGWREAKRNEYEGKSLRMLSGGETSHLRGN